MNGRTPSLIPTYRLVLRSLVIFGAAVLAFTFLGVLLGPPGSQVGGTRPAVTIPAHIEELVGFGLLLGIGTSVFYGRKGLPFVVLTPMLVVLLDIDHIPAYLGFSQPIRPAHSLVFIASVLLLTTIVIRRVDFDLVVLSGVAGHMAVDTGLFPPFAPLSFQYLSLDPYRVPLFVCSILSSLGVGVLLRLETKRAKGRG